MRLMLRFTIPVEAGNEAAAEGKLGRIIEDLVNKVNAEAAYFTLFDGDRGGMIFFEEADQAKLPVICEQLYAELEVSIEFIPVLTLEDLKRGLSGGA